MTEDDFRRLALELPDAVEKSHMDHPDFRVANKVFASLDPKNARGMVKLTPEEQAALIASDPDVFEPCAGAWGRRGCTYLRLAAAKLPLARGALLYAWRNTAPKKLLDKHDD
jgi:hypothetical protein